MRTSLRSERGVTLVELMFALVVITVGVLALVRVFPTAQRSQTEDRLQTSANLYAQEKIEYLSSKSFIDAELTVGRHPGGSATESCGSGKWQRWYQVDAMASPLDNLKKVTVTVSWNFMGTRSVTATTYLRR